MCTTPVIQMLMQDQFHGQIAVTINEGSDREI